MFQMSCPQKYFKYTNTLKAENVANSNVTNADHFVYTSMKFRLNEIVVKI